MPPSVTSARFVDFKTARHRAASVKVDADTKLLLEASDFATLESRLIERLVKPLENADYLLAMLVALSKRKSCERFDEFLGISLDMLREQPDRSAEREFLAAVLVAVPAATPVRVRLIELLAEASRNCPNYSRYVSHFKVETAPDPFAALEQVESWLAFDQGKVVYGSAYGVGTVTDINLTIGTLKVAFQNKPAKAESFRIGEAHKLLQPLDKDHFLRAKFDNPAALRELAVADSGELIRRVFLSVGQSTTLAELRNMLAGIVDESVWSAWWSKARQDPRLTVGSGARPSLSWSDSAEAAGDAIAREFDNADARGKLELAQKHSARSESLAGLFCLKLAHIAGDIRTSEPALALEMALAVEKIAGKGPNPAQETTAALLAGDHSVETVAGVRDRNLRKRAVGLVRERAQDWAKIYLTLLAQESDTQILTLLYETLRAADQPAVDRLVATVLATPERAPNLYLWLCREMAQRAELTARADYGFLQALLGALNNDALKGQFAALRKMLDPGAIADTVVRGMSIEQARSLLGFLDRGVNLEDFRKESLRKFVFECQPDARAEKKDTLYTTVEALERQQAEFKQLISVDIPHNTREMERAKQHGDLRENFEYHAARAARRCSLREPRHSTISLRAHVSSNPAPSIRR